MRVCDHADTRAAQAPGLHDYGAIAHEAPQQGLPDGDHLNIRERNDLLIPVKDAPLLDEFICGERVLSGLYLYHVDEEANRAEGHDEKQQPAAQYLVELTSQVRESEGASGRP